MRATHSVAAHLKYHRRTHCRKARWTPPTQPRFLRRCTHTHMACADPTVACHPRTAGRGRSRRSRSPAAHLSCGRRDPHSGRDFPLQNTPGRWRRRMVGGRGGRTGNVHAAHPPVDVHLVTWNDGWPTPYARPWILPCWCWCWCCTCCTCGTYHFLVFA